MTVLVASSSAAMAQSAALSQKAADASRAGALLNAAKQKGHVRVIAMFNSPVPASAMRSDAQSVANIKSGVAAARDAIIASHFGNAKSPTAGTGFPRGLTSFPITAGFAVNVSAQELEALASDPRVKSVQEDRLSQPSLNDSVPLIGMPAAN
ncbi:MAG: protease inhibitor I9 family protein, partial [Methylocystis sp.]|nr:protease inhibitor I9 family protein [Methylocystis sp.]